MQAMAVVDYARPLALLELPEPSPPPGHALLRVLTCGVCHTDLKVVRGRMPFSPSLPLPHVPGHEICGEVVSAPPHSEVRPGDRVVVYNYQTCGQCAQCRSGRENLCQQLQGLVGFTLPGGFQEWLTVAPERLFRLPASLPPEMASVVACALATAYRAVAVRGAVRPAETAVVIGAGGVGLHALQIARTAGARTLAVDIAARKRETAAAWCDAPPCAPEEAQERVHEATAGRGAELVVDTVGHAATLALAVRLVRAGGRVVLVGYDVEREAPLPTHVLVMQEVTLLASRYGTRSDLERVLSLLASGAVRPVVDGVLPLTEANEALRRLAAGEVMGRVVLQVAS
ncbi:MAG: zinc-dependent alcohol dehydrogenase [Candidatus Tectimicrobiota bacterium]|nr:MAG: zinc-dependent alcohol dehydrogenase [Candidatus Tectomicrobia bacterium]